jgi:hypothetical protein
MANNMNRNKPSIHIATQLHTPLPRPGGVSASANITTNTTTTTNNNNMTTSMEAVNRSRSNIDPLASVPAFDDTEFTTDVQQNPSPEEKVIPVDMYTNQFLCKIRYISVYLFSYPSA